MPPKHASLLASLLQKLLGEMHIYVTLGEHKALEVKVEDKDILVIIKNPIIAAELGLEQWLLSRGREGPPPSKTVEELKKQGYTITVSYKGLKLAL